LTATEGTGKIQQGFRTVKAQNLTSPNLTFGLCFHRAFIYLSNLQYHYRLLPAKRSRKFGVFKSLIYKELENIFLGEL
jgi:hypothetical protein